MKMVGRIASKGCPYGCCGTAPASRFKGTVPNRTRDRRNAKKSIRNAETRQAWKDDK